uniref:X-box-binding protein 1 n=1 Tax=Salvator merianae TaxID=96440 RepID=A0A8D0E707_SALMN
YQFRTGPVLLLCGFRRDSLTPLSPLRKLKNRVAAQSARDRKKARLGELERQAVELEAENQKLLAENEALRDRTRSLVRENRQLRLRLGLPQKKPASLLVGAATGSAESAALRLRVPLQQGQAQQSPASPGPAPASAWIMQTALTLQTLSLICCWAFWTAWIQTCSCTTALQESPVWRTCGRRPMQEKQIPYQPPPVVLWGPHHPSWRPLMN